MSKTTEPTPTGLPAETLREAVRQRYGQIAASEGADSCCAPECCSDAQVTEGTDAVRQKALGMGYSPEQLAAVPEGANLGLGCGNPGAIAALKSGETVVDLGSGGGFDCFLAAAQVGEAGRVIGVDMTPEMVAKARANQQRTGVPQVEFRLGEIEHLPVGDDSVDVILSNCVVNLSPDKPQVFRDAFRVLRSGGRLAISDVVTLKPIPQELRGDVMAHVGCITGAATVDEVRSMLAETGFVDVSIEPRHDRREMVDNWLPGSGIGEYVVSATIEARKP